MQQFSADQAARDTLLLGLHRQEVAERQATSYIGRIGQGMAPLWTPLGFDWRAGVGILTGVAAKEIVLSTMYILYLGDDTEAETKEEARKKQTALKRELEKYYTPLTAFIFMIFVLLYTPCFAAVIAISREVNWKWGLFVMCYTTILAWVTCYLLKNFLQWFT